MSISFHRQESPTTNHAQGLVTFVGTIVCALGLVTGEGFVQADYVEPGTSRMKAAITYSTDGFSGFLFGVANFDRTVREVGSSG